MMGLTSASALKKYLHNRKIAVLGFGESGRAVLGALQKFGSRIFLSDSAPRPKDLKGLSHIETEWGGHTKKILDNDLIIVSPGIPLDLSILAQAKKKKIPIWGELELGSRLLPFKKVVAVTGTNGKTTTVSLLGDMALRQNSKTLIAGNIGKALCGFVSSRKKYSTAILETSSYQLESIVHFHPQLAILLNLTNDHLARHKTMQAYARAKARIFLNQTSKDIAVINRDDPWCWKMARSTKAKIIPFSIQRPLKNGVFLDRDKGGIIAQFDLEKWGRTLQKDSAPSRFVSSFPLPRHLLGSHNIENACAAIAGALCLGVSSQRICASLKHFKPVAHRLEKVATIQGVRYINDSKATNVDSTIKALQSFKEPLWLILGGREKGGSYQELKSLILEKCQTPGSVKGIFLIGEGANKIGKSLHGVCPLYFSENMEGALHGAFKKASAGEVVLLAPACASFDQYSNYEERGDHFKQLVHKLKTMA